MEEYILPEEYGTDGAVVRKKRGIGTGRLWYAALVPLFGIFIEIYADSFALGVLVWLIALIMGPAACLLDRRYVEEKGFDVLQLKPVYALLPPLYIFKRTKLTGDSQISGIVWCIMLAYALFMNGFTQSLLMDESMMVSAIENDYWSSIAETEDVDCDDTIGVTLAAMGGELEWTAFRADGYLSVRCTGKSGFGANFKIDYDGYAAGKYHLVSLTINDEIYEGEDAAKIIKERFKKAESSSSAESGTESAAESAEDTSGNDEQQAA